MTNGQHSLVPPFPATPAQFPIAKVAPVGEDSGEGDIQSIRLLIAKNVGLAT